MRLLRAVIEGFAFFCPVNAVSDPDLHAPGENIAELLSFMGIVRIGRSARFQREKDRLHLILLGVRDDPEGPAPKLRIHLFKEILFPENDLLRLVILKEFLRGHAQALQNIQKCLQRRRCCIPFDLGDKAFGKLGPVRKLFLVSPFSIRISLIFDPISILFTTSFQFVYSKPKV